MIVFKRIKKIFNLNLKNLSDQSVDQFVKKEMIFILNNDHHQ